MVRCLYRIVALLFLFFFSKLKLPKVSDDAYSFYSLHFMLEFTPLEHPVQNTLAKRPAWWQWPMILSLDAPLVAIAWQHLLAQVAHTPLRPHHILLLFAATWLVYAADRWTEGFDIAPAAVSTQRHRFYQQHPRAIAIAILLIATAALALAIKTLTPTEWRWSLALAALVAAYLILGPLLRKLASLHIPKEIVIAILFALGTACMPLALAHHTRHTLIAPIAWFAALCLVNLALISLWEREADIAHRVTSVAQIHPALNRAIRLAPWALLLAATATAIIAHPTTNRAPLICTATSALLMGILDLAEPTLGRQPARVLSSPLAILL
ncbi:MAG: hypothetical protein M9910_08485 [Kiritimatiellae bacterium]|nr:hypothetical protein [Kiritimatiellia bacterium]